MKSSRLPPRLFKKNRSKLAGKLPPNSIAILCSNHQMLRNGDQYYPYRQHSDFYYLTGITQEESIFLIIPEHPDTDFREVLFILKPNPKMEIWFGRKLTLKEASAQSGIKQVQWLDKFDGFIAKAMQHVETFYFNFPENPKVQSGIKTCDYQLADKLQKQFPGYASGRLAPIMTRLRMFKETEEIDAIKHACMITNNAFKRILPFIEPGIMEYEAEAEILHEFLKSGAEGYAYDMIIATGKNTLVLHYIENNRKCKAGDMLLMDFGAEYLYYAADCTRSVPVSGKFSERQRAIYDALIRVLRRSIELMTVGRKMTDYHSEVGLLLEEEHIKLGLYNAKDITKQDSGKPKWKQYYMHGTSHSIGLDVHDPFDTSVPFSPGMVLSCEPAIYIPEENIGIRLENDILITEKGPVDLMENVPIDPDEIEALMNR